MPSTTSAPPNPCKSVNRSPKNTAAPNTEKIGTNPNAGAVRPIPTILTAT